MEPYLHKVKYYECDSMGITHHSNYVRFMEEARIDMMDQLGYGFEKMEAEGVVSPVVSITCNYKKPTTFQDVISITLKVKSAARFKLEFEYTMTMGGVTVFTGTSLHCFLEGGRPIVLEDRFPELYKAMMEL